MNIKLLCTSLLGSLAAKSSADRNCYAYAINEVVQNKTDTSIADDRYNPSKIRDGKSVLFTKGGRSHEAVKNAVVEDLKFLQVSPDDITAYSSEKPFSKKTLDNFVKKHTDSYHMVLCDMSPYKDNWWNAQ